VIPGRLGQIEPHDGHTLAVYTDRPRLLARRSTASGAGRSADQEAERLPEAAALIQARRKRQLTSEAARKRSRLPTVRGTLAG
jgi:hypothetical protein